MENELVMGVVQVDRAVEHHTLLFIPHEAVEVKQVCAITEMLPEAFY